MEEQKIQKVLKIKKQFGWPVDGIRYCYDFNARFFDGAKVNWKIGESVKSKMKNSLEKIGKSHIVSQKLSKLPWVQGILITGSVASMNAEITDDIDFWLIVSPRRIWITRAFDWLFFAFSGKRRLAKHGVDSSKVANRFCFNFYTTTDALQLKKHNLSFAMQFVDAIPLWFRDYAQYGELVKQNEWVCEFFPEWYSKNVGIWKFDNRKIELKRSGISVFWDFLEYLAGVLMLLKSTHKLVLSPQKIFVNEFTTWGTERILSDYDQEIITKRS